MELPQPRPFEAEGRKPTHDFLSLYSHSSVQQDPRPPSQGGHLKTHDFLQPLERVDKTSAKEEPSVEKPTSEKPPPPAPPPPMEHVLPGGIGTYSISHISYFNQRLPKPEGALLTVAQASSNERNDENSNCSSYTGSGFTLWEESAVKKGKTGKENAEERPILREAAVKVGNWPAPERPSQSSTNNHRSSYSSLSSSQSQGQKSQSFMEMIKSAKGSPQDDDLDDEEEFVLKESSTTQNGELRVKVDGKSTGDQKPNTPRSKHSATEQRRRSKINDRFHMLRELIPHSDQKRDKASFLLEVIEYIQFLQEKVHKYEGSYQGWNHEPTKLIPWRNTQRPAENFGDQSRGINSVPGPAIMFAAKLDEKNITVSPTVPPNVQIPVESDISTATTLNAMNHCPVMINKAMPFPMSLQPHLCSVRSGGMVAQLPNRLDSDAENIASQPRTQLCHSRSCNPVGTIASDKLKEQELAIEGGSISISSVYSQGLLNTLTQALQSSGVDLSKASISVQIELGKQANIRSTSRASIVKDNEIPSSKQGTARSRVASEESNQALKKQKIVKS